MRSIADAKRYPANCWFVNVPLPIVATERITRLEKLVWAAIYSQESVDQGRPTHLSNGQLARRVGSSRTRVSMAVSRLVEVGLLEKLTDVSSDRRQHGTRRLRIHWPDWLIAEIPDEFVRPSAYGEAVVELDDEEKGGSPSENRGGSPSEKGGSPSENKVVSIGEPSKKVRRSKEGSDREGAEAIASAIDLEEVEELNLDDESRAADEYLVAEKERRAEERDRRRPRKKKIARKSELAESDLRTPSRREVFGNWRGRDPSRWSARDVVGYFIWSYRAGKGEEPSEFFATLDAIFKRQCSNVRKYIDRWLDGDAARAKALVDRIFERAEERGMPLKLGYFFTPANEATALRLEEPVRKGRPETPVERNDRLAQTTDFDARARRQMEMRRQGKIPRAGDC